MEDPLVLSQQEIEGIYTSCGSESVSNAVERRTAHRWPFPAVQLLGPCGSWGLPKRHMFVEVRCHDLSQGGISFFLPRPPTFESAVMGLGKQSNIAYYLVKLIHFHEHIGATKQYLIGCQFLERVRI